jgi:hypothetical protein
VTNPVLVITGKSECPAQQRIWGTGGWIMPETREALDWATLARLLGWGVDVVISHISSTAQWVILALPLEEISAELTSELTERLASQPTVVITRAAASGSPLALLAGASSVKETLEGKVVEWIGPGPTKRWACPAGFLANRLDLAGDAEVWAATKGSPVIAARQVGRGTIVSLGFHPSEARDRNGAATALLRELLIRATGSPVAYLDFQGTLFLRMDDPGGAQNLYSTCWQYPKLARSAWREIARDLKAREGRLSVCYVSGWVDDGDSKRGRLNVDGKETPRIPGAVHPSPLVIYQDASGTVHDYQSEFQGIEELRHAQLGEVELHGYTHIQPDREKWLQAADRYDSNSWYRELGVDPVGRSPLEDGLESFARWFHTRPAALICPGDEWNNHTIERALDLGFELVSSYYLGIRDAGRLLWATHVCAPYLDKPDSSWFESGLPVIGYFHDRELALDGVTWMSHYLDLWKEAGAQRLMDLRELAGALGVRITTAPGGDAVHLTTSAKIQLVRPCRLSVYAPGRVLIPVFVNGRKAQDVVIDQNGYASFTIPNAIDFSATLPVPEASHPAPPRD